MRVLVIPALLALLPISACRPSGSGNAVAEPTPAGGSWTTVCAAPLDRRMEEARRLALREAEASRDGATAEALEAWMPRGRDGRAVAEGVGDEGRGAAWTVVRRLVRECGLDDAVALTTELVRFQTVSAVALAPDNPEFAALADFLRQWADDAGLTFRIHGPHDAYELILPGRAAGTAVRLITHADVVAVNDPPALVPLDEPVEGWSSPPFRAETREGRLYGRGVEDDKGPIAAALVDLALLSAAGLQPDGDLVVALGTGEEADWDGMMRYAAETPAAAFEISVDAEYPVVIAEDGFVAWGLKFVSRDLAGGGGRRAVVASAEGGLFLTQVPDRAEMTLAWFPGSAEAALAQVRAAAEAEVAARGPDAGFSAEVELATDGGGYPLPAVHLVAHGRSVHSSKPEDGANALWLLAAIAGRLDLDPHSGVPVLLGVIERFFDGDHFGEKLGLAHADPLMGPLVVSPTLLRYDADGLRLEINMRRPEGLTREEFQAALEAALARIQAEFGEEVQVLDDIWIGSPFLTDADSPLVRTLQAIYREDTGEAEAGPIGVRGGTYARLFPGAVTFGPCFPDEPYRGHAADEFLELRTLEANVRMLSEAFGRLGFSESRP